MCEVRRAGFASGAGAGDGDGATETVLPVASPPSVLLPLPLPLPSPPVISGTVCSFGSFFRAQVHLLPWLQQQAGRSPFAFSSWPQWALA